MKNLLPVVRIPLVLSENPAKAFDLRSKGYIFAGYDADLVVMEHKPRKINREELHSRAGWSPFEGMEGIFPRLTLVRGEVVWDGEVVGKSGHGKFIPGAGTLRNVNID